MKRYDFSGAHLEGANLSGAHLGGHASTARISGVDLSTAMRSPARLVSSVIAYYRVSTGGQARSGLGLAAQQEAVQRFVAAEGLELIGELTEVETGKGADALDRRPVLREALAQAKRTKAAVVVSKLDRLSRDLTFHLRPDGASRSVRRRRVGDRRGSLSAAHLRRARPKGASTDLAADTRRVGTEEGARRTAGQPDQLNRRHRRGRLENRRIAASFAGNVLPVMKEIRAAGANSYRAIAATLNARGIQTARGGAWHAGTVRGILLRHLAA